MYYDKFNSPHDPKWYELIPEYAGMSLGVLLIIGLIYQFGLWVIGLFL